SPHVSRPCVDQSRPSLRCLTWVDWVSDHHVAMTFQRYIRYGGTRVAVIPHTFMSGAPGVVRSKNKRQRKKPGPQSGELLLSQDGMDPAGLFTEAHHIRQMAGVVCLLVANGEKGARRAKWRFRKADGSTFTLSALQILHRPAFFLDYLKGGFFHDMEGIPIPRDGTIKWQNGQLKGRLGDLLPAASKDRSAGRPLRELDAPDAIVGMIDGTVFEVFEIVDVDDNTPPEEIDIESCQGVGSPTAIIAVEKETDTWMGTFVTLRVENGEAYQHCVLYMLSDELLSKHLKEDLDMSLESLPGIPRHMHIDRLHTDRGPMASWDVLRWVAGTLKIETTLARAWHPRDKPNVEGAIGRIKALIMKLLMQAVEALGDDQVITMRRIVTAAQGNKARGRLAQKLMASGSTRKVKQRTRKIRITLLAFERLLIEAQNIINLSIYSKSKPQPVELRRARKAHNRINFFEHRQEARHGARAIPTLKKDLRCYFPTCPVFVQSNGVFRRNNGKYGNGTLRDEGRQAGILLHEFAQDAIKHGNSRYINVVPSPRGGFWWFHRKKWHTICATKDTERSIGQNARPGDVEIARRINNRDQAVGERLGKTTTQNSSIGSVAAEVVALNKDSKAVLPTASPSERKEIRRRYGTDASEKMHAHAGFQSEDEPAETTESLHDVPLEALSDPDAGYGLLEFLAEQEPGKPLRSRKS
ncbi:hypothetical protein, partial [Cupriavidus sp. CuC1]|uniref:hypothetical protein n=1 Tax=Cupriavidus sp. CuC1 TaxID=3373131 RepID=UPI0037CD691F